MNYRITVQNRVNNARGNGSGSFDIKIMLTTDKKQDKPDMFSYSTQTDWHSEILVINRIVW